MWTALLLIYGVGLAVTAVTLLRTQKFKHDRMMNAGSIVFWPIYWILFLVALFQSRPSR